MSVTWGSMRRRTDRAPKPGLTWTAYDWLIFVALIGVGWGAVLALVRLVWIEIH